MFDIQKENVVNSSIGSTQEKFNAQYRKLSLGYHSGKNQNNKEPKQKFKVTLSNNLILKEFIIKPLEKDHDKK